MNSYIYMSFSSSAFPVADIETQYTPECVEGVRRLEEDKIIDKVVVSVRLEAVHNFVE